MKLIVAEVHGELVKCPYCGGRAYLRDSKYIYHNSRIKGKVYVCENYPECDSYVGCHKGTTKPLGRLADKRLRYQKKKAHEVFDPLWLNKTFSKNKSLSHNRHKAYEWLAEELGMSADECHIGKFDSDTCKLVIMVCSRELERRNLTENPTSRGFRNWH